MIFILPGFNENYKQKIKKKKSMSKQIENKLFLFCNKCKDCELYEKQSE